MKLTRISTEHYNGQSPCKRCNPNGSYSGYRNWSCMMVEFAEIDGHYCYKCAKEIEEEYLNKVQVIIEVDEDTIKSAKRNWLFLAPRYRDDLTQAIRNCIVLPKGHGRLIEQPTDADIAETIGGQNDFADCIRESVETVFENAETIIEADGGAK